MQPRHFDVLLVYSDSFAESAASIDPLVTVPFGPRSKSQNYNEVYGYFLSVAKLCGLSIAFTSSADVTGAGSCGSYWSFVLGQWKKILQPAYANQIFDKLSPTSSKLRQQRALLFSEPDIAPFNNPKVHALFLDKLKTYKSFPTLAIPTALVKSNTPSGIELAVAELHELVEQHPHSADFTSELIMKDRLGAGGKSIYKFAPDQLPEMATTLQTESQKSFVLQPFLKFDQGYQDEGEYVLADIRLIYLGGSITQAYVRIAQGDAFLCNEHQGGLLKFLEIDEIPAAVVAGATAILQSMDQSSSLFALDFVLSNAGNAYFLEGNTGPGLDWNPKLAGNIVKSKEFIWTIVAELCRMVGRPTLAPIVV